MAEYTSQIIKAGKGALNLAVPVDQLDPEMYSRLTNVKPLLGVSGFTSRLGLTAMTSLIGSVHHSVARFSDSNGAWNRVWGIDSGLYFGQSGALALIDTGYSGETLSLLPYRIPYTGQSWMIVANMDKMRKVRLTDGLDLPLGLAAPTNAPSVVLLGAGGLDSTVGNDYDYVYIHFDTRTGARSNPSPISAQIACANQSVTITPTAYGDAEVHQMFYRRGATLPDDWYFVSANGSDGGALSEGLTDLAIAAAGTVEDDNDAPVTSVNTVGNTIKGQTLQAIFGPVQEVIFGVGDRNRPGHLYWSKPGTPDMWPAANVYEVCSPSEELLNGVVWGGQAYVWSTKHMYAIYPDPVDVANTIASPTAVGRGLAGAYAFCVGPNGIYAVDQHGAYLTNGASVTDLTTAALAPLFRGETVNGYSPIDMTSGPIKLAVFKNELWITYRAVDGRYRVLVLDITTGKWRIYDFATAIINLYPEIELGEYPSLLMGGNAGYTFTHTGTTDNSEAIDCNIRTAILDGGAPRAVKALGDVIVDADRGSGTLTITSHINHETTNLTPPVTISSGTGFTHSVLDAFGESPQQARDVCFDFSWSNVPDMKLYSYGYSFITLPEVTIKRATDWEDLGIPNAKWLKGVVLIADVPTAQKTLIVEAFLDNDSGSTVANLVVPVTSGIKKIHTFTWPAVQATLFRIRPTDSNDWMLYDVDWIVEADVLGRLRWEGQPTSNGIGDWQTLLDLTATIRSNAPVFLDITSMLPSGSTQVKSYRLPTTLGAKIPQFVQLEVQKGSLFTFVFTSESFFWLYPNESFVRSQPWAGGEPVKAPSLGFNDVQDSKDDGIPASTS